MHHPTSFPKMLSFNTDCERFVMHDDAPVHEEDISDLGQASSDLCVEIGRAHV